LKTIFSYFRPASGQMKSGNYKTTLLLLMLIWFIINLVQAIYTEVLSDEAYYGLFGKYLDWGYFDHPPMVALLIRVSSLFFTGNLGLRFMTILLQPFTLYLIWKISDSGNPDSRKVITLFIIAGSISLFSVYGVFAAPDSPLLFFTALFLFVYKRFINGYSWSAVLLLSVSMTGLIYSKYQAVLVIGFVILSNLRLLRIYRFWVAGIITLVLLSPHIYWQISNNFPGFQYHLIDRSEGLRWNFLIEYLPNQIAVFNPLILGAVIYVFFKYRSADQFERSLRFQIIGILIFFWFISFSGHVEPHWTIVCSIPMIVILSDKSNSNPSLSGYARRYLLPSILLFLIIRIRTKFNVSR